MVFAFYGSFCKCVNRRKIITKKQGQFLKSHISRKLEEISFKFGMWSTDVGWCAHSKNHKGRTELW